MRPLVAVSALALALAACDRADAPAAAPGDETATAPAAAPSDPEPAPSDPEPAPRAEAPAPPSARPSAATTPAPAAPGHVAPGHVALNYLIGDVDPASDPAFARIPEKYIGGSRVWGHKDAVEAFVRMAEAAAADGHDLRVVSAFRSFRDQKRIWEDKWTGKTRVDGGRLPETVPDPKARALKILEFSSMPGTSRHHWGTDFDLNSLNNSWFASGEGRRLYDWLTENAPRFGFCQVYTAKAAGRTGYEEEKWHWSYAPVASWYLRQYPVDVGYDRLAGFEGAETAKEIGVIETYVDGIDPACR